MARAATIKYQIPADVTANAKTLLYDNEKFFRHGKPNKRKEQRWLCTKNSQNCRAACSTKEVDGIVMMRIINSSHTHPCSRLQYPIFADVTSDGINLVYQNETFYKHSKRNTNEEQRWRCTKSQARKCRAACSTKEVDGILMMRMINSEHSHTRDDEMSEGASASGPVIHETVSQVQGIFLYLI